jgi:phthiodiolone/phenolphthiodiolone dimycocerosates ketoreductase
MSQPQTTIQVGAPGIVVPPFNAVLHTARRNEERGFDAIWWPDHLMGWHPNSVWTPELAPLAAVLPNVHAYYDPIACMAAAAQVTERIALGTSVTEPARNHPAQLARAWLTLDHLSGGRSILGIGAGEGENITPYGIAFDRPAGRLEDALRVVRLLWTNDDPVDYDGPVYTLRDAVCGMQPISPGAYPPIWVAAHGPRLCRVTGELADGWLPTMLGPDEYAQRLDQVKAGAIGVGRDPDEVTAGMWAYTIIASDHDTAHALLSHPMVRAFTLALHEDFFKARGFEHPLGAGNHFLEYIPTRFDRETALRAIEAVPFEVAHDAMLHGSPSDIAKKIETYARIGLRHIALWNVSFFADASLIGPSYRLLTEAKDEIKRIAVEPVASAGS